MENQPTIKQQLAAKAAQTFGIQSQQQFESVSEVVKIARTNLTPERYDRLGAIMCEVLAEVIDSMPDKDKDPEEGDKDKSKTKGKKGDK
ncbi:MAG: hypothetical protein PVI03_02530 [Candidatus Thorarchaeota archaeon]|jgi:hypothetical protein